MPRFVVERVPAEEPLGHLLQLQVVRHDQMAVAGEPEPRHVDPGPPELVELAQEVPGIHHHAVCDHRRDVRIEDAGGSAGA